MAIFGHSPSSSARDSAIDGLNSGGLHGLVMTDKVSWCGHNLTGANVMIFMGSLYSEAALGNCAILAITVAFSRNHHDASTARRIPFPKTLREMKLTNTRDYPIGVQLRNIHGFSVYFESEMKEVNRRCYKQVITLSSA